MDRHGKVPPDELKSTDTELAEQRASPILSGEFRRNKGVASGQTTLEHLHKLERDIDSSTSGFSEDEYLLLKSHNKDYAPEPSDEEINEWFCTSDTKSCKAHVPTSTASKEGNRRGHADR